MAKQSRGSLNAGFNHEIQNLLQVALIPAVEKGLLEAWGADWIKKLDERRATPPDLQRRGDTKAKTEGASKRDPLPPLPKKGDGTPRWDTNTLLHAVREYGRELPNVQRSRAGLLKDWCYELRDLRNGPSHTDPETFQKANSDRNLIYQAAIAIRLLRAFNAHKEAEELEALMDGPWAATLAEKTQERDPADKQPPEENTTEKATLIDDEASEPVPASVDASTETHTRRRTDLPAPGQGVCLFPLAGQNGRLSDDRECLASAHAGILPGQPIVNFAVVTGDQGNSNTFYQIIRETRGSEPDNAMLDTKTRVRLDSGFIGNSFGLAVAIADRSARYGFSKKVVNKRIVATGALLEKHQGEVEAIDHFLDKIAIVQHFRSIIPKGSLFIFPLKNLETDDTRVAGALKQLDECGIEYRAVAHINELNDLFPGLSGEVDVDGKSTSGSPVESSPVPRDRSSSRPAEDVRLQISRESKSRSNARVTLTGIAASIGCGALLIGIAPYLIDHMSGTKVDVAALQASDARLQAITRLADMMPMGQEHASDCLSLIAAARKLVPYDTQRVDDVHNRALQQATRCESMMSASDARTGALRAAVDAFNATQPESVQNLADARMAVTSFDESREDITGLKQLISSGDNARSRVEESNRRIADFDRMLSSWTVNEADAQKATEAMAAYLNLEAFDLSRMAGKHGDDVKTAQRLQQLIVESDQRVSRVIVELTMRQQADTAATRQKTQNAIDALNHFDLDRIPPNKRVLIAEGKRSLQAARIDSFKKAAADYEQTQSAEHIVKLVRRYDELHLSDRIDRATELTGYLTSVEKARLAIGSSDERLTQLDQGYEYARSAEAAGNGLASSYVGFAQAILALTDIDKERLSAEQKLKVQHGNDVRNELLNSDRRILKVTSLSELALKLPPGSARRDLMESVVSARRELTPLDKDRMSAEQLQVLKSACEAPIRQQPSQVISTVDTLPAVANLECYDAKDFEPEMIPAVR